MASRVKYNPTESGSLALGQAGNKMATQAGGNVTPESGVFVAITILSAAKFSALTPEDSSFISETDLVVSTEVPAGITLYGRWTSVTLSQGKAICYYG